MRRKVERPYAIVAFLALALSAASTAFAWGHPGHEYVGAIADQLLTKNAAGQVKTLVGIPLRLAARWADCVKDVRRLSNGTFKYTPDPKYHVPCEVFETPEGIARMEDYAARNWDRCNKSAKKEECHKQYHYTDVAIQRDRYDRKYVGTSNHDIVGALGAAIRVLQGQGAPEPFSIKDKTEALFLIAHLVGDVHQPLHVGSVYLDANGKLIDPDAAPKLDHKTETRGGNSLDVSSRNLHSEWDGIAKSLKSEQITDAVIGRARKITPTQGAAGTWPKGWATDSILASHAAFEGVSFVRPAAKQDHWVVVFENRQEYVKKKRRIQAAQLTKGGAHLAHLLNNIWPD